MSARIYRYEFEPVIVPEEIEASLLLAIVGTESLHGETATQLGARHFFDADKRVCIVDAETPVGSDFNSLFAGFLRREFGNSSFRVRRVASSELTQPAAA
jgi:hypothetical protein